MIISTTRKSRRAWWLGGAVAASAVLAWGVIALADRGGDSANRRHPASPSLHGAGWGRVAAQGDAAPVGGSASAAQALPTPMPIAGAIGPVGTWHVQPFRADAQGQLVLDAGTQRTLEQVHAFNGADELVHAAEDAAGTLPEKARRQAVELAQQYGRYDAALRQAVNPSQSPGSVDDMAAQFKAMQALRQEQFGAGAAQRLFGEQEAITVRLIQLMQEDAEPQASLEEKAARAQARLSAERMTRGS
ncbi:MAG: lipase secretion chaperone [Aquabacterium sp.]|jgi:hypothetical protein|uniref:lipase secretion chaperone n=1 Tax=Aquabacterium sp. TaxID=1872578 RepID=UPI003BAFC306